MEYGRYYPRLLAAEFPVKMAGLRALSLHTRTCPRRTHVLPYLNHHCLCARSP